MSQNQNNDNQNKQLPTAQPGGDRQVALPQPGQPGIGQLPDPADMFQMPPPLLANNQHAADQQPPIIQQPPIAAVNNQVIQQQVVSPPRARQQLVVETPSRVYNQGNNGMMQQNQIGGQGGPAGGIRVQQRMAPPGSAQMPQDNAAAVVSNINMNMMMASPVQSNASTAGPKTLLASAYRQNDASEDRRQQQQMKPGGTTLVPNFRSLSPSIFNIDLNNTGDRQHAGLINGTGGGGVQGQHGGMLQSSGGVGLSAQQQQHIYVSIHPKKTEAGVGAPGTTTGNGGGAIGSHGGVGNIAGAGSNMRIKRVGPINKGDKIKFGVIVARGSESMNRKSSISNVEHLERHEIFETPKQMHHKTRLAIGKHSEAINREVNKYPIYTTTKTLPTVLINQHTNIIKQFKKNFTRETEAYNKHALNSSASRTGAGLTGGYFTDSETLRTKVNFMQQRTHDRTAIKMSKRSWFSDTAGGYAMSIRDVIEEHAKSVAALNKSIRPNIHLEIDEKRRRRNKELEEKGRKIAEKLNLSVHSCCTRVARMYRCLTDEQPIRQHNKPLTQLMRPTDKMLIEKKMRAEDERRKVAEEDRLALKRRSMAFSVDALTRDFKGGLASGRGQTRRVDLKEQKRYIEDFRRRKFNDGYVDPQSANPAGRQNDTSSLLDHDIKKMNNQEVLQMVLQQESEQPLKRAKKSRGGKLSGWDRQRKEIEQSIDNGMTFSHLSRSYPMKREWAKYLVLLRKKEKDRRKKERKINEIIEDLHEKGITDEKVVTKELDMFEYMEFKKKRDRSKARMGAKAETKYYRPVDTERTLKIEKISLNTFENDDDGPGGFKLEDFAGIETMFSKQSLEQRRLRVDRARERLRQKRLAKIEEDKQQKEDMLIEQIKEEMQNEKIKMASSNFTSQKSSIKPSILEEVSKSKETQNAMQFAGENLKAIKEFGASQMPPLPPLKQGAKKMRQGTRPTKIIQVSKNSMLSSALDAVHPSAIIEGSQQHESSVMSDARKDHTAPEDLDVFSKTTSGPIRVEIASTSGQKNINYQKIPGGQQQAQMDTMKTHSQQRDYSLEDGGIFEKKTLIQNTSMEEAKIGESLTHRSYELLTKGEAHSHSEIQDILEAHSEQEIKQKYLTNVRESVRRTNETLPRGIAAGAEEFLSHKDTVELEGEDGEVQLKQDSMKPDENIPQYGTQAAASGTTGLEDAAELYGTNEQTLQSQIRVRPSTTENSRRNIILTKKRRQLMSGQQQQQLQFEQLRTSVPVAENTRFGRYPAAQNEKSAGVITTVNQNQQYQIRRTMINHDSSDQNRFNMQRTQLAATTSSGGFATDHGPQGTTTESQQLHKIQKGVITLTGQQQLNSAQQSPSRQDGSTAQNVQDYLYKAKVQQQTNKTHSMATMTQTADDQTTQVDGGTKVIIWKQLMKQKEEEGLSGSEHLPRDSIKRIRSKVRRDRIKIKKRNQKLVRKMTSMGLETTGSRLGNSMMMQTSGMPINGMSPFRNQSDEEMHRTQTMAGLRNADNSMVEIQGYTNNQRRLQQDSSFSRNAGFVSNEVINRGGQGQDQLLNKEQIEQMQLAQGISEKQFATQPQQQTVPFMVQQQGTPKPLVTAIEEATSSSYLPTTTQILSSTITPTQALDATKLQQFVQQQQVPIDSAQYNSTAPMQGKFALGFHQVATEQRHFSAMSLTDSEKMLNKKNFVEINRTCVRANSLKKRLSSHMGRVRQLRSFTRRRGDSLNFQAQLSDNMTKSLLQVNAKNNLGIRMRMKRNYPISLARLKYQAKMQMLSHYASGKHSTTSQMYPSFQNQLDDRRSMKVIRQNDLAVDPDIDNEFSRNQAWNETLNCPYFGLMALRKTQEVPINSESKAENILRPFSTGNQADRMHSRKVMSAIKQRNKLREVDSRIYDLIDLCQKSTKIEWKSIYRENEEFRNQQMKKKVETKQTNKRPIEESIEDLLEMTHI